MSKPVVCVADAPEFPMEPEAESTRFGATIRPLSSALGLDGLGIQHVTVEPGRRAFPFHNHLGNDEMFLILSGTGTYRYGETEHAVKAGDVCAAPRGGPDKAHQLVNTGTEPLVYYGISTRNDPDVVEYPDSGKFAAFAIAPGENFFTAHLRHVGKREDTRGYWDGEEL